MNWYGEPQKQTIKGIIALINDVPVGIGGIALHSKFAEAFSEITPELLENRIALVKIAKQVCELFKGLGIPVIAVPDEKHVNAARFLNYLGFQYHEGVYIWRN